MNKNDVYNALKCNYIAKREKARVNFQNYLHNSAGVAEHPDVVGEMDKLVQEMDKYRSLIETLNLLFDDEKNR